jgi:hypothetical protein
MHGTLIGVFVTTAGLLVGADTAVTGGDAKTGQAFDKTCWTSDRTVATIQGQYGFVDARSGAKAPLVSIFRDTCDRWRLSRIAPSSISAQVAQLTAQLRAALGDYLRIVAPGDFKPPFGNDLHVLYVMVAGYEHSLPVAMAREVRLVPAGGGRWAAVDRESSVGLTRCGARFHGEDKVAAALLSSARDARVPTEQWQLPEVVAGRIANAGDCSRLTPDLAKKLFVTVVRSTIQLGSAFGISRGVVGGPLQLIEIHPNGEIHRELRTRY